MVEKEQIIEAGVLGEGKARCDLAPDERGPGMWVSGQVDWPWEGSGETIAPACRRLY